MRKSILAIIVVILAITFYISFPNLTDLLTNKTPLYVNLQKDDLTKIETLLKEKRYEYTIKGNSIYVSKYKVAEIRNNMSSTSTLLD